MGGRIRLFHFTVATGIVVACSTRLTVRSCSPSACPLQMLIPKKNRKLIYEHIFKEGVLVAKKDFFAPKHSEIESVPNLQVIKAMQVRREGRGNGGVL